MAENYTYDAPVPVDWRNRAQELEHQLAQADGNMVALAARNADLAREVAGLRYYIGQLERNVAQEERAYAAGVASLMLTAQLADDGPDAPLTLAAIDDEDGDL